MLWLAEWPLTLENYRLQGEEIPSRTQLLRPFCSGHDLMSRTWNAIDPTTKVVAIVATRMISDWRIRIQGIGF
jgi:hypothetical protein